MGVGVGATMVAGMGGDARIYRAAGSYGGIVWRMGGDFCLLANSGRVTD